jgi:hypothetical protein
MLDLLPLTTISLLDHHHGGIHHNSLDSFTKLLLSRDRCVRPARKSGYVPVDPDMRILLHRNHLPHWYQLAGIDTGSRNGTKAIQSRDAVSR